MNSEYYGRLCYEQLQQLYTLLTTFHDDYNNAQSTLRDFLQGLYNPLFAVCLALLAILGCMFVIRYFFPDSRG